MAKARIQALSIAWAVLLTSPMAVADSFVHVKVGRKSAPVPTCFDTISSPNQGIGTGCQIAGDSGFAPVVGSAFGIADGVAVLGTSAHLSSDNSDGSAWEAIGYAAGTDVIRISAFGLDGTQGAADIIFSTHTADIRNAGSLVSGTMGVISEMVVSIDGNTRLIHSLSFPRILPPYAARIFFVYGEPFELAVSLESKVSCTLCTGTWSGVSDATNTAELEIIEVDGLTQEEFLVESLLGETYANVVPVPEPSAALMNVVGLLAFGMFARYSRHGRCRGIPDSMPF